MNVDTASSVDRFTIDFDIEFAAGESEGYIALLRIPLE